MPEEEAPKEDAGEKKENESNPKQLEEQAEGAPVTSEEQPPAENKTPLGEVEAAVVTISQEQPANNAAAEENAAKTEARL